MAWIDLPFAQARRYLIGKRAMTREQFDELFLEERVHAWTVTGISRVDVLQHVLDRLADAVAHGDTLAQFEGNLEEILSTAGLDPIAPWRAETVFRTGVQSAYGRGRFEQMTDPDIASEVWGWRYVTVGDDRVRDEHAALEGKTFRTGEADHLFPPIDFNCRCGSEIVLNDEMGVGAQSSEIPPEASDAVRESSFTSPAVSYDYNPDLSGYDAALANAFLQEGRERFEG